MGRSRRLTMGRLCRRTQRTGLPLQTIPYFFTLLKKVLLGMPSSRAATLLLPFASFKASIKRWRS